MGDNFAIWKQHFINQAKGLVPHQEKFYKVASQNEGVGKGITSGEIKMVTPTQEVVERAKTQPPLPPAIYDPISGVMAHSLGRPRSVRKYKKARPTKKKKVKANKKNKRRKKRGVNNRKKNKKGKKYKKVSRKYKKR